MKSLRLAWTLVRTIAIGITSYSFVPGQIMTAEAYTSCVIISGKPACLFTAAGYNVCTPIADGCTLSGPGCGDC